jgi:hypothetical protein
VTEAVAATLDSPVVTCEIRRKYRTIDYERKQT